MKCTSHKKDDIVDHVAVGTVVKEGAQGLISLYTHADVRQHAALHTLSMTFRPGRMMRSHAETLQAAQSRDRKLLREAQQHNKAATSMVWLARNSNYISYRV